MKIKKLLSLFSIQTLKTGSRMETSGTFVKLKTNNENRNQIALKSLHESHSIKVFTLLITEENIQLTGP